MSVEYKVEKMAGIDEVQLRADDEGEFEDIADGNCV